MLILAYKYSQWQSGGAKCSTAHNGRVKGQGSKHNTEIVNDCDLVKIMLSRLFLRRYSLLSRTRSLPLRGDIENAPGNVSFFTYLTFWCALFRVTFFFFFAHTQTEHAFPDTEQSTAIFRFSGNSFIRIFPAFRCYLVPAEEEGNIAVSLCCCHLWLFRHDQLRLTLIAVYSCRYI